MGDWHRTEIADVALELGTDLKNGKIRSKSEDKRKSDNSIFRIPSIDSESIVRHMASDASLVLLAVTYILTAIFGHLTESLAGIILIVILFAFACYVKFISSKRISHSYELLLPNAKVIEDGQNIRLSVFDVEVGDLIHFAQGDIIPADARLVSSSNLYVAERYINELNGKTEYKRIQKNHDILFNENDNRASYENMVYASTMVVSGKGSAIVTAIGDDTVLCKTHSGISVVPENDKPSFLQYFNSSTKKISLFVLLSLIPVSLLGVYTQTLNSTLSEKADMLYLFLICLSLSVTSMSELVIAPAEAIVTKEILLSSRKRKDPDVRITKLSAVETLADVDTLLILCREAMVDKRNLVRRVIFSDKQYRFDALKSQELTCFWETIYPYFNATETRSMNPDTRAIAHYLNSNVTADGIQNLSLRPKFLRNYPIEGARACVLKTDDNNMPLHYIAQSTDYNIVQKCNLFRTEGGGTWKIDDTLKSNILARNTEYIKSGLKTYFYVSHATDDNSPVFEGMIAVGEEYPFADGELIDEFTESVVLPVLVIENEAPDSLEYIMRCGIVRERNEVVLASDYAQAGLLITDAPISAKVYVGFGRTGTAQLTQRLIKNGRKILPIIKDSANRRDISPLTVYATHTEFSYDSVRIASSVSLKPADSLTRSGGVFDALKTVKNSSMARLKLGVFKNYLIFSSAVRISAVAIPMILGKTESLMSSLMILISGFFCDFAALFAVMLSKGTPVRPKNTAQDARSMYSPALAIMYALCGTIVSSIALLICNLLQSFGKLSIQSIPLFMMYTVITAELFALGGFLLLLRKRTRHSGINTMYICCIVFHFIFLIVQSVVPDKIFEHLTNLDVFKIDSSLIPFILIAGIIGFAGVCGIKKISSDNISK